MATVTRSALHTPLCDLLGIRYPICQAGMAFVARSGLAAAVSQAGGLGVIAAAHGSPAELRAEIHRVREETDQPFGVDILFATVSTTGAETDRWRIVAIDEEGTVVTRAVSGKPNRQIRNAFTREWEKREAEIQPFPVQFERVGKPAAIRAREAGDIENGSAACGQSAGLIHDVRPAGEIIAALAAEASAVLARLPR